ncbi:zinc-finger domain-containing protein [Pararhodospirillum oryzae]|uniref:Zinc-finger domain-containing protein n=1 Tax=Pararhodospirillum oryzae TaxID=478448 RepID=A0A512H6B1_9PROT|nr:zinc-finger domain-containing protein [Pararhodospirillum oryzae]GEO80981.1 zinc-finger domain-containing protein [Pararhodospirillum oryzae]
MTQSQTAPVTETVTTATLHVTCEGSGGALGHPRVALTIRPEVGEVVCPYCSRRFVASPAALAQHGAH